MNTEKEAIRKHDRVLEIYTRLLSGEVIHKEDLAEEYGVTPRSIQRDIDSVRDFYSNRATTVGEAAEIRYDRTAKGFRIISAKTVTLTNAELFAVAKILLESRSLSKQEMEKIISDLINACLPAGERKKMKDLVGNEIFHYVEPRHGKILADTIWELGTAVYSQRKIKLKYQKANGEETNAVIKPVGIMESEYYFYLIAYVGDKDKEHPGYPTIYRIDRIQQCRVMDERFVVPYKERFEDGEFRKRIPFMFGGPLTKVEFIYKGPDIDAVLDRLPTAEYKVLKDGEYRVKVEVYGTVGIEMWLRSQGNKVSILSGGFMDEKI